MRRLLGRRAALLALGMSMASLWVIGNATPASADETGLAQALHDVRREGRRLCLVDHFHDGYSAGQPTRKIAEREAVKEWAGFTAFEYGSSWGIWSRAANQKMACAKEGAGWACHAMARPCR